MTASGLRSRLTLLSLKQAHRAETDAALVTHHEVVVHIDAQQGSNARQLSGSGNVASARRWIARRVVVREQQSRRAQPKRIADNRPERHRNEGRVSAVFGNRQHVPIVIEVDDA
jgi:hypothetical protein